MANRDRRDILRGAGEETLDLLSEVLTSYQWAELLKAPLELAARKGNADLAQKLVGAGAKMGQALHEAVQGGHEGIVNDLLRDGASIAAKNRSIKTPLHVAAVGGKPEMVELLLLKGADRDAQDGLEQTPLFLAVCGGHVDTALALMAAGSSIGLQFSYRESVAHAAARSGHVEMLKVVIAYGADVNAYNNPHRRTALHGAAMHNSVHIMNILVDAGADIEARNEAGAAPLHCAAGNVSVGALMLLLKHGADVNTRDRNRQTPLHWAAEEAADPRAAEVVDLLLRRGANETILDLRGEAAVDAVGTAVGEDYSDVGEEFSNLADNVGRVRKLLVNAPVDRAWRRRGYLVLCRAHPDRMQLQQKSSSAPASVRQGPRSRTMLGSGTQAGECNDPAGGGTADEQTGGH